MPNTQFCLLHLPPLEMRTCVRSAWHHSATPSRYLLEWSGLYRELTSFVGNQVWALEIGCRGVLWVVL